MRWNFCDLKDSSVLLAGPGWVGEGDTRNQNEYLILYYLMVFTWFVELKAYILFSFYYFSSFVILFSCFLSLLSYS